MKTSPEKFFVVILQSVIGKFHKNESSLKKNSRSFFDSSKLLTVALLFVILNHCIDEIARTQKAFICDDSFLLKSNAEH